MNWTEHLSATWKATQVEALILCQKVRRWMAVQSLGRTERNCGALLVQRATTLPPDLEVAAGECRRIKLEIQSLESAAASTKSADRRAIGSELPRRVKEICQTFAAHLKLWRQLRSAHQHLGSLAIVNRTTCVSGIDVERILDRKHTADAELNRLLEQRAAVRQRMVFDVRLALGSVALIIVLILFAVTRTSDRASAAATAAESKALPMLPASTGSFASIQQEPAPTARAEPAPTTAPVTAGKVQQVSVSRTPAGPAGGVSGAPLDREIVIAVLETSSPDYIKDGFGPYTFGTKQAEVTKIARQNLIPAADGNERFVFDSDELVGYKRQYSLQLEERLAKLRDLFGTPRVDDIYKFESARRGRVAGMGMHSGDRWVTDRTEGALMRYSFPTAIGHIEVLDRSSVPDSGLPFQQLQLWVQILDRNWAETQLVEDVAKKRQAATWAVSCFRQLVRDPPDVDGLPGYAGTKRNVSGKSLTLRRERDGYLVANMGERGPSSFVQVSLRALPDVCANPLYTNGFIPVADMTRMEAWLVQQVMPPAADSVETVKAPDDYFKTRNWRTVDGWRVTITGGGSLTISSSPEPKL